MARKAQRWYEVEDGTLYIYNQPMKSQATACSIVRLADFGYYRNNFELRKVWGRA